MSSVFSFVMWAAQVTGGLLGVYVAARLIFIAFFISKKQIEKGNHHG